MKLRPGFFLILGLSYFYTLSNLPIPFLIRNYLAIVPFQLLIAGYFIHQFLKRRDADKLPQSDKPE
jgi:hypothetical protein